MSFALLKYSTLRQAPFPAALADLVRSRCPSQHRDSIATVNGELVAPTAVAQPILGLLLQAISVSLPCNGATAESFGASADFLQYAGYK